MTETVLVVTPLRVEFAIRKDPSGVFYGHIRQYPGIVSQARTVGALRRKLIRVLREISREHPEELTLFR